MSSAVSSVSPLSLSFAAASAAAAKGGRPGRSRRCRILAIAGGGGRDSLNQQQRLSQHYQQQPPSPQTMQNQSLPPKRRIAQSAPLGLWDRFPSARTIQQMMDTMERIMEDPFAYNAVPFPSGQMAGGAEEGFGGYRRGRTPWEIKEGEGEYKMRFDMPGMTKKDVRVSVEDNMLVIRAEKVPKKKEANGEAAAAAAAAEEEEEWSATSYGRYSSRIALPESVVVEKIKAEVKDGVLYITLPKAASASGKVLDIDVK